MKCKRFQLLFCILSAIVLLVCFGGAAAESANPSGTAVRTIMLYGCGSNLETDSGMLTFNLKQILTADFPPEINFVVLTGGSERWEIEAEYLEGAEAIGEGQHVQLWLCSGRNGANAENGHGKMTLLDSWPAAYASASMSDEKTLLTFLTVAAEQYPAEIYDLILWDHGGGPHNGFGVDEYYIDDGYMSVGAIARALKQSPVAHLDILDFDACLMGNAEVVAALGGFADYMVISSEVEPGFGQEYNTWLNLLAGDPRMNGFELGRHIVDAFVAFYEDEKQEGYGMDGTLAVVDTKNFRERLAGPLTRLVEIAEKELTEPGELNWKLNYYDELNTGSTTYRFYEECLADLASLSDTLGICRHEMDNNDIWRTLENVYTETTQEIKQILADRDGSGDDVLYSGHTGTMVKRDTLPFFFVRNMDGDLVHPDSVSPSGLSLFWSPSDISSAMKYDHAMTEAIDTIEDEQCRAMLDACRRIALRALLIYESGRTVSELMDEGDQSVFYKDVRNRWMEDRALTGEEIDIYKEQKHITANITGMTSAKWKEYVGYVIEALGAEKTADTERWLAAVAAQQAIESISADRAKAVCEDKNGDGVKDAYRVTVNSPMSLIKDVSLVLSAELDLGKDEKEVLQEILGDRVPLGKIHGFPATEGFLKDMHLNESIQAAAGFLYDKETADYDLPTSVDGWYELRDSEGNGHVITVGEVDLNAPNQELEIPVIVIRPELNEYGEPDHRRSLLYYSDGKFTGILDLFYGDRKVPLSDKSLDNCKMCTAYCQFVDLGFMKFPVFIRLCEPFELTADKDRGLSLSLTPLAGIRELNGRELSYEAVITDIYDYEHNINPVLQAADASGDMIPSIEMAEITATPIMADGTPHMPEFTVNYGGKILEKGTDYNVMAEAQSEPGEYKAVIYGMGSYVGYRMVTFTVDPGEK